METSRRRQRERGAGEKAQRQNKGDGNTVKEYKEFNDRVKNWLRQYYGKDWSIEVESVTGNNGVVKDCLLIQKPEWENKIAISLMPFYQMYQQGIEMVFLCWGLIKSLEHDPLESIREQALLDFGQMKERVVYRLINADLNEELLKKIPSIPFQDLAIVFALLLDRQEDDPEAGWETKLKGRQKDTREVSCLIHYGYLKLWGIDEDELYPLAAENTPRLLPLRYQTMVDAIGKEDAELVPGEEPEMYVITNQEGVYGAAAILYPGALKDISDQIGSDLLILPSSVHELILLPFDEYAKEIDFWEMVAEVNQTEVPPEDILSGEVYRYDRNEGRVTIMKPEENEV